MRNTKYRCQVLTGYVQLPCRDLLRQTCNVLDVQILKGGGQQRPNPPVPSLRLSDLIRRLKGRSAKLLLQEFPELKRRYWGGHFWSIGYGAWCVGNITDEVLEAYLNHHKGQPNEDGNFILA